MSSSSSQVVAAGAAILAEEKFNSRGMLGRLAGTAAAVDSMLQSRPLLPNFSSDLFQLMLRYLPVNDLLSTMHLSKGWYAMFNSVRPLRITSNAHPDAFLDSSSHSTIARHISCVSCMNDALVGSSRLSNWKLLHQMDILLPNLETLSAHVLPETTPSGPANALSHWFPSSLKVLSLCFSRTDNPGFISMVFAEIASKLTKLQQLDLRIVTHQAREPEMFEGVDFSPLLALASRPQPLQSVDFLIMDVDYAVSSKTKLAASMVLFIQQSRVSTLSIKLHSTNDRANALYTNLLGGSAAIEPPCPLLASGNLTSLKISPLLVNRALLEVLSRYSTLTELPPCQIDLDMSDVILFSRLPQVTSLDVSKPTMIKTRTLNESIVAACKNLPNLRKLRVADWGLSSEEMDECLANLPFLSDLSLTGSPSSTTFAPLVKYGLPQRLTRLELTNCFVPVDDLLENILQLRRLEYLRLYQVSVDGVTHVVRETITNALKLNSSTFDLRLINGNSKTRNNKTNQAVR